MAKIPTIWPLTPHTKAKHQLLTNYLAAWYAILGNSKLGPRFVVYEGFAGPGVYEDGEPGSPIQALETLIEHDHFSRWGDKEFVFLFNEQDGPRFDSLVAQVDAFRAAHQPWPPNVTIMDLENRKFSDLTKDILDGIDDKSLAPTFAFIDPFGYMDIPITLVKDLLRFNACELFIYFDFNSVNRFATAGNVDPHFGALFGTTEFQQAPASGPARHKFLHDLYERQLKSVCSFAHVQSFAMVNDTGHIGNYMFFCTRDLQAFDRMKAAMWKLDPTGEFRFEDRFDGQDILFGMSDATGPLQAWLLEHFAGRTVAIDRIIATVIEQTPYYSGQVKKLTLAPMQRAGKIGAVGQKTRNTFPPGTRVVFPALNPS